MYANLNGSKFICKVNGLIKHVEILAAIPSEYFSDEGFNGYLASGNQQSPGAVVNNTNNYLSFWVEDIKTHETFRASEYEMLMKTDTMSDSRVNDQMKKYIEEDKIAKRVEKYGELGFDKHFYKCKEMDMTDKEALESISQIIKIRIEEDGDNN